MDKNTMLGAEAEEKFGKHIPKTLNTCSLGKTMHAVWERARIQPVLFWEKCGKRKLNLKFVEWKKWFNSNNSFSNCYTLKKEMTFH